MLSTSEFSCESRPSYSATGYGTGSLWTLSSTNLRRKYFVVTNPETFTVKELHPSLPPLMFYINFRQLNIQNHSYIEIERGAIFNIFRPSTAMSPKWSVQIFQVKFCTYFSPLTCLQHILPISRSNKFWWRVVYNLWSSSLCNFLCVRFFPFSLDKTISSTSCSQTILNLWMMPFRWHKVSRPYKTTDNISLNFNLEVFKC